MKCCVIQPLYSSDYSKIDELFRQEIALLDSCDESVDVIVLPEASDVPALSGNKENFRKSIENYSPVLLKKCSETAIRCNAFVFVNAYLLCENGLYRNTTHCINRKGEVVGRYFKQHLTPDEVRGSNPLDSRYSFEYSEPEVLEIEGVRIAFLTCYDFYFYEMFSNIARKDMDIIIGCSHQRSDTSEGLDIINRFLCFNTNAYLIRSSVTFGEDSETGGGSMIVSPRGDILANLGKKVGIAYAEIDPKKKYFKPAGFGNPKLAHYEYIEKGRRPMKYRPAGPSIVPDDINMCYPRLCAHRGYGKPENTLPSLAAAVSLSADEIEFDVRVTKDGELVSIHDSRLDRTSSGHGNVSDHTYEELLEYDFGGGVYPGLKICKFEEILQRLTCHCVMNIHLKPLSDECIYDQETFIRKVGALVDKYDCKKHVYFMSGSDDVAALIMKVLPWARVCLGGGYDFWGIVDRAIKLGCYKVQLVKGSFNQDMIDKAHSHGIFCNVWWSNEVEEAKEYLRMGVDTILTDDYLLLRQNLGTLIRDMSMMH